MGALRALLPACALVKSRGRRDQPSNLPGAGAPPRCSARGGAHQGNAARKTLAMLLTPTRPWLSNERGPGHTHVPVSHDPAGKKRKMQGISRTRPHSPPGGWGEAGATLAKCACRQRRHPQCRRPPPFPGQDPSSPAQELEALSWHPYITEAPRRSRSQRPHVQSGSGASSASSGPAQTRGRVTPQASGEEPLVPLHPLCSEEIQESSAPVG